jgi:netrin receptor unc-5
MSRETVAEWIKFTVNVIASYSPRGASDRQARGRGESYLWIPREDLQCKCPKIRLNRRYFIMGKFHKGDERQGYVVDRKSKVVRWKDKWNRRLRRYIKRERRGHCRG